MATKQQLLDNLRTAIIQRVQMCNDRTYPKVCELSKSSNSGLEEVTNFVMNLVVKAEMTIIEAITEMERSLDPNRLKD